MTDPPGPRRRDPLALAVFMVFIVVGLVGAGLLLRSFLAAERDPQRPAGESIVDTAWRALDSAVSALGGMADRMGLKAPPPVTSGPRDTIVMKPATGDGRIGDPQRSFPGTAAPATPHVSPLPAKGVWIYEVFFGPRWQYGGQLYYLTEPAEHGKLGAKMSWTPAGGSSSTWFLGIVEARHASHANTRFPGFFMHPAYFPRDLELGDRVQWEFPWQAAGSGSTSGRVRRFDMRIAGWERVEVSAGGFDAARLEGTLRYIDDERVKAEVRYTLWYAPRARQVVRLVWLGRSPDEAQSEMVAELNFYADHVRTVPLQ